MKKVAGRILMTLGFLGVIGSSAFVFSRPAPAFAIVYMAVCVALVFGGAWMNDRSFRLW